MPTKTKYGKGSRLSINFLNEIYQEFKKKKNPKREPLSPKM